MEKSLPFAHAGQDTRQQRGGRSRAIVLLALGCLATLGWVRNPGYPVLPSFSQEQSSVVESKKQCLQAEALFPAADDALDRSFEYLSTSAFEESSIARLSNAVKVQTESFDDLGVIGEDKRWDVFYNFHTYLKATFPRIHDDLQLEKINTHGLLYTWAGSDDSLKPLLLMAHQDVVPVERSTIDKWTFPPWSGHFDGKSIWGRGSSDCKNSLIGIMETVEHLLKAGFKPKRTVILSFGFDEECSGKQGAGHLGAYLQERYGDGGVAAIVDEGSGYTEAFGQGFAIPGVTEKGYTDVEITVRTPGGHSSIPTDHTSIGILSEIIAALESKQYRTFLDDKNPFLELMSCSAKYAPDFPPKLGKLLDEHSKPKKCKGAPDHLAIEAAKISPAVRYLMQTSQAVDIISGGAKVNALPEVARATVNHRINIGDMPETVYNHIAPLVRPIAKKYNLTLHAFDDIEDVPHSIILTASKQTLVPAPVTPTDVTRAIPYTVLAGTVRALFGDDVITAPMLMTGNTDTRHYWSLTDHIFRFAPGYIKEDEVGLGNIHTVDERISVTNHFKLVKWYTLFIRNMDAFDLE